MLLLFLLLTTVVYAQAGFPPSTRERDQVRVQFVGSTIAPGWRFSLVQDSLPYAGMPSPGLVIVSEGLLDLGLDDDELAGVLAHEVAHGQRGDVVAQRVPPVELSKIEAEFAQLQARKAQLTQSVRQSAEASRQLEELERWSHLLRMRKERLTGVSEEDRRANHASEMDADLLGRRMAEAAGYKVDGLLRALVKIQRACSAEMTAESYTHPALERRIEALNGLSK